MMPASRISRKLVLSIILFSSFVTLIVTSYQLVSEYNREMQLLERGLTSVQMNFLDSVNEALWIRDIQQLKAIVRGLKQLPDVKFVEISDEVGSLLREGDSEVHNEVVKEYALTYKVRGEDQRIGSLRVVASTTDIQQRLYARIFVVLASNGIKTFLVALFALFLFERLVSKRLMILADSINEMEPGDLQGLNNIDGLVSGKGDEIDKVVMAFNELQNKLKRAEDSLLDREQKFQLVSNLLPAMILYIDSDRIVRFANRTVSIWNDSPLEDIIDKPLEKLVPIELLRGFAGDNLDKALAGSRQDFSFTRLYPDGNSRAVQASLVPHLAADGSVAGVILLSVDVSERETLELQLRQSQKMESVGQLTGGVAHDFNNLLAVILGSAEVLKEDAENESRNKEGVYKEGTEKEGTDNQNTDFIDTIIRSVERGAVLTGQLLAFSRKQNLEPKALKLDEAMGGFIELLRRTLGADIAIETVSAAGLWACYVDSLQLENAILNLALNARDAMPGGGKLTIETRNVTIDDEYAIQHLEVETGRYVLLAVSDTGVGISKEHVEHVFEPFFTTKDVDRGTGLGLSMVYGFVKQSKGHISIYSEPGEGTTVKLYLPIAEEDAPGLDASIQPEPSHGKAQRILVVEDEIDVRRLVVKMIEDLGYQIIEAGTGEEALAIVNNPGSEIDLVLSDVMLPGGMMGPDFIEKAMVTHAGLKVVYMTGYAENAVVHNGHLNRDVFVLQKPFRKSELARKLAQALSRG